MDALLGLLVLMGGGLVCLAPLWFLFVWVPKGGCRCKYVGRYHRRVRNPNCPEHQGR